MCATLLLPTLPCVSTGPVMSRPIRLLTLSRTQAMEVPSASGRYLCAATSLWLRDLCTIMAELYPGRLSRVGRTLPTHAASRATVQPRVCRAGACRTF